MSRLLRELDLLIPKDSAIREVLVPLTRMGSGYSKRSRSAVGTDEIADVESGNQPLTHACSGNLNNQEGNDLAKGKLQVNSENVQGAASVAPKVKGR